MNIYINNIKITLLADAGSLNVGTTLNMVQNRVKAKRERRVGPQEVLPPRFKIPTRDGIEKTVEEEVPTVPTVQVPK